MNGGSTAAVRGSFARRIACLDEIVAFTADAFSRLSVDSALRMPVDFAIEELFTNMVKYSGESRAPVEIEILPIEAGVQVTLTDRDVDRFDVTEVRPVDTGAPIGERKAGGLGLYLIRRMVDGIGYQYNEVTRESRICFRKTAGIAGGRAC
jgi:anti-sigma regulatory factor (Ser/Thr protein kinase)